LRCNEYTDTCSRNQHNHSDAIPEFHNVNYYFDKLRDHYFFDFVNGINIGAILL
jgi:hypothetical protein